MPITDRAFGKKVVIALIWMASALALTVGNADARHLDKKAHPAAASASAAAAPATPIGSEPEPAWKSAIKGMVTAVGADGLAADIGMEPAWFGIFAVSALVVLLAAVGIVLRRVLRARAGPPVYAGDYLNSVLTDMDGDAESGQAARRARIDPETLSSFDMPKFLEEANANFVRLQAAWDRADLNAIRELTTPALFAEFKLQILDRGATLCKTQVEMVEAELLELDHVGSLYTSSIQFVGMIKEEHRVAVSFVEIWHLVRPASGAGQWLVADIRQLS